MSAATGQPMWLPAQSHVSISSHRLGIRARVVVVEPAVILANRLGTVYAVSVLCCSVKQGATWRGGCRSSPPSLPEISQD